MYISNNILILFDLYKHKLFLTYEFQFVYRVAQSISVSTIPTTTGACSSAIFAQSYLSFSTQKHHATNAYIRTQRIYEIRGLTRVKD